MMGDLRITLAMTNISVDATATGARGTPCRLTLAAFRFQCSVESRAGVKVHFATGRGTRVA
jgi:hypothetical protein